MENIETTTRLRIRHAQDVLTRTGVLTGAKDTRVTARVQAGLLEDARRRTGIQHETIRGATFPVTIRNAMSRPSGGKAGNPRMQSWSRVWPAVASWSGDLKTVA